MHVAFVLLQLFSFSPFLPSFHFLFYEKACFTQTVQNGWGSPKRGKRGIESDATVFSEVLEETGSSVLANWD